MSDRTPRQSESELGKGGPAESGRGQFDPGPDRYDFQRARKSARARRKRIGTGPVEQGSDPSSERADVGGVGRLAGAGAIGILGAIGTALFGWARAKGLAVELGPPGLGVYGQLWTFVLYAGQVASLGIGVGATALVAYEHERGDQRGLSLTSSLTLMVPAAAGLLVLAVSLAGAPFLAPALLDSNQVLLFALAAISIPFVAVQAPLQHVIQGLEDVVGQTVAYLVYGAAFTLLAVAGAVIAGVEGAAVGLTLGNVLLAALYLVRSRTVLGRLGAVIGVRAARLRSALRSPTGRALLRVGASSVAITVAFGVADLAVRTTLLREHGDSTAGYWYALQLISVQFVAVVAAAMTWIAIPVVARLSERDDAEAVARVIDSSVRLVCLTIIPLLALLCALRDPIVGILFTSEFSAVSDRLPAELAGDWLRSLGWTLGIALVPLGYVRAWTLIGVGSSVAFGAAGVVLASGDGLEGAVTAWVIMWGISLLATAAFVLYEGHWRPSARSALGLVIGAVALAGTTAAPGAPGVLVTLATLALLAAFVAQPSERQAVLGRLRSLRGGS